MIVYEEIESQKTIARFGRIVTNKGSFNMPFLSPGLRTKYDCEAIMKNIQGGLYPQVITPYASRRNSVMYDIKKLLGISYEQNNTEEKIIPITPNVLVIPDPEYEALSFHCKAREKFKEIDSIDKNIKILFETGLSNKHEKQVESVWKKISDDFGYTGIKDWATSILQGVESDCFFSPTHIIKSNSYNSVRKAFDHGYNILDEATADAKFTLYGIHFLLHWNIFKENNINSALMRQQIFTELDNWMDPRSRHSGTVFSFKIFDKNNNLSDPSFGSVRRRILSHFISEISQRIRNAKGVVITHNFGNWTLGCIDSGADIATFRVSGKTEIEIPLPIGNLGSKSSSNGQKEKPKYNVELLEQPSIFNFDTLTESDVEDIKRQWNEKGTFPVPACMGEAIDYWNLDHHDQQIFCIQTRCGTLVELSEEYRNAGIDIDGIPLSEALKNRVISSDISQEMQDLCPSLGINLFSLNKEKTINNETKLFLKSFISSQEPDYKIITKSLVDRINGNDLEIQDFFNMVSEVYLSDVKPFEKTNVEEFSKRKILLDKIVRKIKKEIF